HLGIDHDFQQTLGRICRLAGNLLAMCLARIDLRRRGQAASQYRLLQHRFIEARTGSALLVSASCAVLSKSGHQAVSLFGAAEIDPFTRVPDCPAGSTHSSAREISTEVRPSQNVRREHLARYMKVCFPPPKCQRASETSSPLTGPERPADLSESTL